MEEITGIYVISVAARLLEMHPQTLRKYERFGLVTPARTVGIRRLYSNEDISRLRAIKFLVDEVGLNLAGVELALKLVDHLLDLKNRVEGEEDGQVMQSMVHERIERMLQVLGAK